MKEMETLMMSPRMHRRLMAMTIFVLGVICCQIAATANAAAIDVYVTVPPPAQPRETIPASQPGYVWAPGYYALRGANYTWVSGSYIPARYGYTWVPDRWYADSNGRYRFMPGRWAR